MATQPDVADSRSPGLTLTLSSNNPFRNRATSPAPPSQLSPSPLDSTSLPSPRPVSRNPFLDASGSTRESPTSVESPQVMAAANGASPVSKTPLTGNAAEIFDNLTLNDKPPVNAADNGANGMRPPPPGSNTVKHPSGPPRAENVPPRGLTHRPSRSQEAAMRARRVAGGPGRMRPANGESNIFADPESPKKSGERRVRRNSESSVVERNGKPIDPEEEKKRQERRRRDRRHREAGKDPRQRKPDRKLDIIDQLDATSIYGTGLFHHDGPFDACNPHRNRQGSRRAPMQAFPKDSLNNVLGGGGPLNKRPDHATFLGNNDEEAFKDYAKGGSATSGYESYGNGAIRNGSRRAEPNVQSALQRVEPVHGDESLGLGTSTFLEGAPASRTAIQRRETESAVPEFGGGLSRKKSLAQKIRGISNNKQREFAPSGRVTSPEGVYSPTSPSFMSPGGTQIKAGEKNPFFNEFTPGDDKGLDAKKEDDQKVDGKEEDKKGESITIVEPTDKPGRQRAPSSPRRGFGEKLERRVTSDGSGGSVEEPKQSSMGFLSRVKSLKGGPKRSKSEKPAV